MAKPDIWMPLYIGDYLADTMHLTTEQHGAYLLLIMAYWKNSGPLSSNDQMLAATCRLSLDAWSMHKHMLASFFDTVSDPALWILPRAEKEMEKAGYNQEKRVLRAQKAAAARWGNNAPSNATSNAPSNRQAVLEECPSPSPSYKDLKEPSLRSVKKPEQEKPAKAPKPVLLTLEDLVDFGVDRQHAIDWLLVRKQKKAPLTPTAWKLMVSEAAKAKITTARAVEISAARNWQSLKAEWLEKDNGFSGANTGTSSQGRPSLVERVRQANAHLFDESPPPIDERDWPEFDSIREVDGHLVASDD